MGGDGDACLDESGLLVRVGNAAALALRARAEHLKQGDADVRLQQAIQEQHWSCWERGALTSILVTPSTVACPLPLLVTLPARGRGGVTLHGL